MRGVATPDYIALTMIIAVLLTLQVQSPDTGLFLFCSIHDYTHPVLNLTGTPLSFYYSIHDIK